MSGISALFRNAQNLLVRLPDDAPLHIAYRIKDERFARSDDIIK